MALKQNSEVGTSRRGKYARRFALLLNGTRAHFLTASIVFILFSFCRPACAELVVDYISSLAMTGGSPGRIASDAEGIIYAAVPAAGKVFRFFRDGSSAGVITASEKPVSVAVDSAGRVYVGDYADGSVRVIGHDGQVLYSLGKGKGEFRRPGDIAVSSNGLVYVTDSPNNIVKVYNPDGTFRSKFGGYGTGSGKLRFPTGICLDEANNEIYVVDQTNGRVEVFDREGVFKRSFGSYGSGQGTLTRGQGIHVAGGKVYVADAYQSRVEVFDTSGSFVSFIGGYGSDPGDLKLPMDVMVIGTTLYVANSDNARLEIFDIIDPQGLDVSPLKLSFAAPSGAGLLPQTVRIDPGIEGTQVAWTARVSGPFGLTVSALDGSAPAQVEVGIDAAGLSVGVYTGAVVFHAGGNDYPVTVSLIVSGPPVCTPITISPSILPVGTPGVFYSQNFTQTGGAGSVIFSGAGTLPSGMTFSEGVLSGTPTQAGAFPLTVTATGEDGCTDSIVVTLAVERQNVVVSPSGIDMFHQIAGELATKAVVVENSGRTLNWSATANAQWLSLMPSSGETPAVVTISLNSSVDSLSEGDYTALVTVYAPDAVNSPVKVPVTVKVIKAGSLILASNLEGTFFTINGTTASGEPVILGGGGTNWRTDELKPGTYTLHFEHIRGYKRPVDRTFDIGSGETVTIEVRYMPLPVANVIVAAKGPDPMNDATIRVFDLSGGLLREFLAMKSMYGARVAMADIDGDGTDEILVSPGNGSGNRAYVKVFRNDGSFVTRTLQIPESRHGGIVAAGDIDGDSRTEVALSSADLSGAQSVIVYAFDGSTLVERTRILLQETAKYPAAVAFGDIDGDGWLELLCASSGKITAYAFDADLSTVYVVSSAPFLTYWGILKERVTVAADDLDGDGIDEVLLGYGNSKDSLVQVLNSQFAPALRPFRAFENGITFPAISSMDLDGDGIAEVLAGQGPKASNDAALRVFDSRGRQISEIRAFDSIYGVNAAFGVEWTEGEYNAQ